MRKQKMQEVITCDACGKEIDYSDKCLNCGVELCYECAKNQGETFSHGVYVRGSGDGYYCNKCIKELTKSKDNVLFNAYVFIKNLREEYDTWHQNFENKRKCAEKTLESISEKHK